MNVTVEKRIKERIVEDFPLATKNDVCNINQNTKLKQYFENQRQIIKEIMELEALKNNPEVSDYDFFEQLLKYCEISLSLEDKEEYLKEALDGNYKLQLLKTTIPNIRYDVHNDCVINSLLKCILALRDDLEVDLEHIYTQEELVNLQNINKGRLLSLNDEYQHIDAFTYSRLSKEYKTRNLLPLDFDCLNRYNYRAIFASFPYLGTYIRHKLDFSMISNVLLEYEQILSKVINNDIKSCEEVIENYNNRIKKIKSLTNY